MMTWKPGCRYKQSEKSYCFATLPAAPWNQKYQNDTSGLVNPAVSDQAKQDKPRQARAGKLQIGMPAMQVSCI